MIKKIAVFIVFVLVISTVCFSARYIVCAQEATEDYLKNDLLYEQGVQDHDANGHMKLPGVGEVIFKMVIFLGIVLLLMFGLALAFQKFYKGKLIDPQTHQDVIKILSYRKFDAKRGIYLVDVLGKVLVVGSDIDGLNLITEITEREQVEKAHTMTDIKPDLFTFNPFHNMLEGFSKEYKDHNARERRKDRESRGLLKKINELKNRLDT